MGSSYRGWTYLLLAVMCLTSMSLQGTVTWLNMVKLLKTWKHESSSGDSLSVLDPKWFDPTKEVSFTKTLWHHCYLSFKCPCGIDDNNPDQNVYKQSNEKQRIVGEDWKEKNPQNDSLSFLVSLCRRWKRGKCKPLVCLRCLQTTWQIWTVPLRGQLAKQELNDDDCDNNNLDMNQSEV